MKNTKAIFLIVLGSFIIATGFAFAENVAYETLKSGPFGGAAFGDLTVTADPNTSLNTQPPAVTTVAPVRAAAVVPAVGAAAPAPAPTAGEKAKKFLRENMGTMALVATGAYLGMALFGPVGIIIGAVFMYALSYIGDL